jgi:phosphatidylserine decarboxylase
MAKEGWPFVGAGLALALIFLIAAQPYPMMRYGAIFFAVVAGFMVFFFRDPQRTPPTLAGAIVSAADGRVVGVDAVDERQEYLGSSGVKVSIFLSPLDVHVNRAPIAGQVDFVDWHRGRFKPAYTAAASAENEHSAVGISNGSMRLVVKQIVGVLARRIVCYPTSGDALQLGERFGLIRFGSRVEHILPSGTKIEVIVGDRVVAGETVIGVYSV